MGKWIVSPQEAGIDAEIRVAQRLALFGYSAKRMPYNSPFDLLVNNSLRVEVKYARPSDGWLWRINFHRHGELDETNVDFYVVMLDGIPGFAKKAMFLVFPAPAAVKSMTFTFATLLRKHHRHIDNWKLFGPPPLKVQHFAKHIDFPVPAITGA